MIPMVEAAYSTVPIDEARRKLSATTEKNRKTATAAISAPISGRPSTRRATGGRSVASTSVGGCAGAVIGSPSRRTGRGRGRRPR